MNDYNETLITGRATDDVKVVKIGDKRKYSFVLATNYFSARTQKKYCEFIPISVWRKDTNADLEKLKKGDNIFVSGRIKIESYSNNEGQKKWIMQVVGRYVQIFKVKKGAKDLADLIEMIKSNQALLKEISDSNQISLSTELEEMILEQSSDPMHEKSAEALV
jgi:single-stranded DNA-binding protein